MSIEALLKRFRPKSANMLAAAEKLIKDKKISGYLLLKAAADAGDVTALMVTGALLSKDRHNSECLEQAIKSFKDVLKIDNNNELARKFICALENEGANKENKSANTLKNKENSSNLGSSLEAQLPQVSNDLVSITEAEIKLGNKSKVR